MVLLHCCNNKDACCHRMRRFASTAHMQLPSGLPERTNVAKGAECSHCMARGGKTKGLHALAQQVVESGAANASGPGPVLAMDAALTVPALGEQEATVVPSAATRCENGLITLCAQGTTTMADRLSGFLINCCNASAAPNTMRGHILGTLACPLQQLQSDALW